MLQESVCISKTLKIPNADLPKEKRPEYSYSAPISEFVPASKPKKSKLDRIISYLCRNPEIKPALRAFLCRDLLTQDTNEAVRRLGSDMEEFHRQNPRDAVITKVVAEVWAVANGMRLVPDAKITASIKQQRKTGFQKFLRHILFGNQDTILIEENVNLAADNEALKLENRSLENRQKEAETKAAEIIKQAVNSAKEIIGSAAQRAAEMEKETELRKSILQTKANSLQKECVRLEELKNKLLKNPDLKTAYQQSSADQFQELQEKTLVFAEAFNRFEDFTSDSCSQILIETIDCFSDLIRILEFFQEIETNFGPEKTNKLLLVFIEKLSRDIKIAKRYHSSELTINFNLISHSIRDMLVKNAPEKIKAKIENLNSRIYFLKQIDYKYLGNEEDSLWCNQLCKISFKLF